MKMTDICRLCYKKSKLEESHIIPRFVLKWIKETSATGYLRSGQNPNRRVQDGWKEILLCRNCEELLNKWETEFANKLFYPLVNNRKSSFEYGAWFLKFAVSLSWRSLIVCKRLGLAHFSDNQQKESDLALEVWRKFLLGDNQALDKYQQHVIPVDIVSDNFIPYVSTNINSYFLRSVGIDPIATDCRALVYIKIPYFIFIGGIQLDPKCWINTAIHTRKGIIGNSKCTVPESFEQYITTIATQVSNIQKSISGTQKSKIKEALLNDPDRVARSETFKAVHADLGLFGNDVFE